MMRQKVTDWLKRQKNSTRAALILQIGTRVLGSALGLVWGRLLLQAMGKPLTGLFLNFQAFTALGGLGDLGIGGAVGLTTGQYLGRGALRELREFLAAARSFFILLAILAGSFVLILSPVLPGWLGWDEVKGTGSLALLSGMGAFAIILLILNSYLGNVSYACGNILWPILPVFILGQIAMVVHWMLAREHAPLWVQYLPYFGTALATLILMQTFIRWSHPEIAKLWPLRRDRNVFVSLIGKSFWVYLCGLGSVIYVFAARLLITKGFGAERVPQFHYNYKLCELSLSVILIATAVSLPKLTQWLASPHAEDRARALAEARRLNRFQTLSGCGAALLYLAVNDVFMTVWLKDPTMLAPWSWQLAFALNLALTAGADTFIQLGGRCEERGLRVVGLTIALTGFLNVALSLAAVKAKWLGGIAFATVIAQGILSFTVTIYVARVVKVPWMPLITQSCVVPVLAVLLGAVARYWLPPVSWTFGAALLGIELAILAIVGFLIGVRIETLQHEWKQFRSLFKL